MFILSKLLLIAILPLTWVIALLIYALVTKNNRLRIKLLFTGLVLLFLFSVPLLLNTYAKLWRYPAAPLKSGTVYSCAIILGGFGSEKQDSSGYFNSASDRFIQGLKLKATNKASHLLITGGNASINPDGFSEGRWVQSQLKDFNMADSNVLIEGKSRNTIENAAYTKQLLAARHLPPPYLLVTSDFHMRRAMLIFKKSGIDVIPYPCHYIAGVEKQGLYSVLPSAETLHYWELYSKEIVGYVVAAWHKY
ncbi:YdcF family protein [Mucilaginibacter sp. CSA2-8R]|uniref:YdcF family protein n=1 Tax=Mucilaginibacter sp. CSA2-8R TaxID=3141542 RepID=UPI00315D2DA3